jgi:hypothetical protein
MGNSVVGNICFPAEKLETEYAVIVHVYELGPKGGFGSVMKGFGMGVYHTGTEIRPLATVAKSRTKYSETDGIEYAFGGSDRPGSGVWLQVPKQLPDNMGTYKKSVSMGTFKMTPKELKKEFNQLNADWSSTSYNLLNRNCNHFSDAVCKR